MMETPWLILIIVVAVLVIPPQTINHWLEGPRTVKHYRRRKVCGDCGAKWRPDHVCLLAPTIAPSRIRIGEAERERVIDQLADHHAAGRLTLEEFEDRMASAWTARTGADLAVLVEDLPGAAPPRRGLFWGELHRAHSSSDLVRRSRPLEIDDG
jgi:hypothetical protein